MHEHARCLSTTRGVAAGEGHFVARVFKAGNSLAIHIPNTIANSIGLQNGTRVDMAVDGDMIWVKRAASQHLHDLIERISDENVHSEQFSRLAKRERW